MVALFGQMDRILPRQDFANTIRGRTIRAVALFVWGGGLRRYEDTRVLNAQLGEHYEVQKNDPPPFVALSGNWRGL